jgi:hypothetical protein
MLVALLVGRASLAQQADGGIEGHVLDSEGHSVEGAQVTAGGLTMQGQRSAVTDRTGAFHLLALPVGSCQLRIGRLGYRAVILNAVVRLAATTSVGSVRLERAVIEMPEIVVEGHSTKLDPASTAISEELSRERIETLPSDRDFRSLATILPQVNPTFSSEGVIRDEPGAADANVAGSSGEGNFYFIDGNDVTSVQGAGARTSMSLPFDLIRAIDVKIGGYEAEYGRAMGGIVNVITPSGGNALHGQAFGYFTNHGLFARSPNTQVGAGDFATYDAGASLEGPILRDRLWFFTAYNPSADRRHQSITGLPDQEVTSTVQRFAGKLTWQASARTKITTTFLGDPGRSRALGAPVGFIVQNPEAVTADTRVGAVHGSLGANHQLRTNLLLRADVAFLNDRSDIDPIGDRGLRDPQFTDAGASTVSGGYGGEKHDHGRRLSARLSTTWLPPRHLVKLGLEYVDNGYTWDEHFGTGRGGGGYVTRYDDTTWTAFQYHLVGTVHMRMPTMYVQDSWSAMERLRINVGLRWDRPGYVAQGETPLRVNDALQPRVGFVYSTSDAGTDKVSGAWGRYFEQLPGGNPGTSFTDVYSYFAFSSHDPRLDPPVPDTATIAPIIDYGTLHGEYFEEWTLGYDRVLSTHLTAGVHGMLRRVGQVIEDAVVPSLGLYRVGNPGSGVLSYLPRATQTYSALQFTIGWEPRTGANVSASYVLSRNHGNYEGLELGNAGPQFDFVRTTINATGDLPNDHRHVFKLNAAYQAGAGLTLGGTGLLESGTPLSELGGAPDVPYGPVFLRPRGTAGRTPWVWDLNARIRYDLPGGAGRWHPRAMLDLYHLLNPRRPLAYDQQRFFSTDNAGTPTAPNPHFGAVTLFQPSFSARMGVGVAF